ncbi:hypothetical protein R6Q57_002942 [Mikania cordata]
MGFEDKNPLLALAHKLTTQSSSSVSELHDMVDLINRGNSWLEHGKSSTTMTNYRIMPDIDIMIRIHKIDLILYDGMCHLHCIAKRMITASCFCECVGKYGSTV